MAYPSRSSAPSPAAVLRRLREDVVKGWPPGVTVLTGDDLFHLDLAQRELLAHLAPEDDALALNVFGDEEFSPADVASAARSVGMFADRRVVLIRDIAKFDGELDPLLAYAKTPPARSFVVIRAPKLDLRTKFDQALAHAGRLLEFRIGSNPSEATAAISSMARDRKLELKPDVAGFLASVCAGDLHRAERELEKLDAWAGPAVQGMRTIRLEDARQIVAGSGLLDSWEAANAIAERDTRRAVAAIRRQLDNNGVPYMILGGLAYQVRKMLQAEAMQGSGQPGNAARRNSGKYTLAELLGFPARLHEADLALKSRGLDHRAVLETLVVDLTKGQVR